MNITLSKTDKVYKFLMDLEGEFIIPLTWSKENRKEFTEIVKEFIRYDLDKVCGFMLEFKSDYEAIRKKELTKTQS